MNSKTYAKLRAFLSTPSGWRATKASSLTQSEFAISIHALRVEGDRDISTSATTAQTFLSTPSGWRATLKHCQRYEDCDISIHALRVEGDYVSYAISRV